MKNFLKCAAVAVFLAMTSGFLHADDVTWMTDYKKAFAQAKAENKYIMIDFSGTKWCVPCMALEKQVFETQKFKDYAKLKFVLLKVDFPDPVDPPAAYKEVIDKYLPEILLPTVVVLSPDGRKLGSTGYQPGGPDPFIASVQKAIKVGGRGN